MIHLPSVVHVVQSARKTAQRYPWVLVSALVSAGLSWFLVVRGNIPPTLEELLSRWLLVAMLGIPTFSALAIALERSPLAPRRYWASLAVGIPVLTVFFLSYAQDSPQIYLYRFFQLAVASHLLVAVAPYYRLGGIASFWRFNRTLFQRILQGALFSVILFGGLSIALWAVQSLLNLKVDWKAYYFLFLAKAETGVILRGYLNVRFN